MVDAVHSAKVKAGIVEFKRIRAECEKLTVLMMMFDVNLAAHYEGKSKARRQVPKCRFYISRRTHSLPQSVGPDGNPLGWRQFWTYESLENFVHEIIREHQRDDGRQEEAV